MIHNEHLNLARKWRSKNFDQVIGQELAIKMLRNSLYLNQLFPVYLFSGQRGCGKTSTARIFACAINCEQLSVFQQQPKQYTVPCLTCSSCVAMAAGQHPDFIEIDAASHTGVDNVRNIIDSATLLPLMGRKKIYLIDEAHMLSKAAFNALLKVLEEPPASALFILATTDIQKVIETVKSRCFQLLFKPVPVSILVRYLQSICEQENITCDEQGLTIIVKKTDGSVRDALNLLEQVRFSHGGVTKRSVTALLGQVDDTVLVTLLDTLLNKDAKELLQFLAQINFASCSVEYVWQRLVEVIRASIWLKYDIAPEHFADYHEQLQLIVTRHTVQSLCQLFALLCEQESNIVKTTSKHAFFEMILLQLCHKKGGKRDGDSNSGLASPAGIGTEVTRDVVHDSDLSEEDSEDEEQEPTPIDDNSRDARWTSFITDLDAKDPLVSSIFRQGVFQHFNAQSGVIDIAFSKEVIFFNDVLNETKNAWLSVLQRTFSINVSINALFTLPSTKSAQGRVEVSMQSVEPRQNTPVARSAPVKNAYQPKESRPYARSYTHKSTDVKTMSKPISTQDLGERAQLLLKYFPGVVTECSEGLHG